MASEREQIEMLKKMLAAKEKTIQSLEAKLKDEQAKAKKQLDAAKEQIEVYEGALRAIGFMGPGLHGIFKDCVEKISEGKLDIPEAYHDTVLKFFVNAVQEYQNAPQFKFFARFFRKGTENTGRVKSPKEFAASLANDKTPKARGAEERMKKTQGALTAVQAGANKAYEENPNDSVLKAIADANKIPDPVTVEEATGISRGRQVVDSFKNAPETKLPSIESCPKCGHKGLIFGKAMAYNLRSIVGNLNKALDAFSVGFCNVQCDGCGHAFMAWGAEDVPVKPGSSLGQAAVINAGLLNAAGIPINKIQDIITDEEDQLGHSTLGRNIHQFALDTGALMLNKIKEELSDQGVVVMDETPLTVLQSRGQGVCDPVEGNMRLQDYIGVCTSPFGVAKPCVVIDLLGSRSLNAISGMLNNFKMNRLITDGYSPYNKYCDEHDIHVHQDCIAHLRRVLLDVIDANKMSLFLFGKSTDQLSEDDIEKAADKAKEKLQKNSPEFKICAVLTILSKVYGYEKTLKQKPGETSVIHRSRVKRVRNKISRVLMNSVDAIMFSLVEGHAYKRGDGWCAVNKDSLLDKAVVYYMNHRVNFSTFTKHSTVPPDSNAAEYAIRAVAVIRKNCDFKQSQEYTKSMCIWLSLYETAKACGIKDVVKWLREFGRALYLHRVSVTLEQELKNGRSLDTRIMRFSKNSADSFEFEPYLPWEWVKRESK